MTFAFYIARIILLENFKNKSLDYGKHSYPVEIWGEPENVKSTILAHNEIVSTGGVKAIMVIFVYQYEYGGGKIF